MFYLHQKTTEGFHHFSRVLFSRSFAKITPSRKFWNLQYSWHLLTEVSCYRNLLIAVSRSKYMATTAVFCYRHGLISDSRKMHFITAVHVACASFPAVACYKLLLIVVLSFQSSLIYSIIILIDFSLTVKTSTFISISGRGSGISSANEGKSGSILIICWRVNNLFGPRKRACISWNS